MQKGSVCMKKKIVFISLLALIVLIVFYFFYYVKYHLKEIEYESFNKQILSASIVNEAWVLDPEKVAFRFVGEAESGVDRQHKMVVRESEAKAIIIEDNYPDDSVRGAKFIIELEKDVDNTWYITSALWGQRCWAGRGHQNYSCKSCQ